MQQNPKNSASWSRFRADTAGTSAVEFAMLAPLFILLLLGMVAYGIYFGASHWVQQIAADAARMLAALGVHVGEADIRVTGAAYGRSVLVQ
jgi:Flp pilus assembly protein TadG